jgi:hypothetical protein
MRRARDIKDARDRESAEEIAKVLVARTIEVSARPRRRPAVRFGHQTEIVDAVLEQTGIELDRKDLHLEEHIKEVGTHMVTARLHSGRAVPDHRRGGRGLSPGSTATPCHARRRSPRDRRRRARGRPRRTGASRDRPLSQGVDHSGVRGRCPQGVPSSPQGVPRQFPRCSSFSPQASTHEDEPRCPHPPTRLDTSQLRVPPHSIEAEESLLGAMLLSEQAISAVTNVVTAEDFYRPAHRHIFDAVQALYGAGQGVDPVTVADELDQAGVLESVGGPATLISPAGPHPGDHQREHYAKIVEEKALLRRLITTANDVAELGYSPLDDIEKTIDSAESMMFAVAQRRNTDSLAALAPLLDRSLEQLEMLYERGDAITGTPTGLHRPRHPARRPAARGAHRRGCEAGHGQDGLRARHRRARSGARAAAGAVLLARDGPPRAHPAPHRVRGAHRRHQAAHRSAHRRRLDQDHQGHGPTRRGSLWIDDNPALTITEIRSKAVACRTSSASRSGSSSSTTSS